MPGIAIIGAGESGARAAFALRENGYDGPVTLIGDEPLHPYERPPLSKEAPLAIKTIAHPEAYAAAGIELALGQAVQSIDTARNRLELPGRDFEYERLLIATGARAKTIPGSASARTLRTFRDAEAILSAFRPGQRILIVGSGLIGMELAATARMAGADVTVLQRSDRVMARSVPDPIAGIVARRHVEEGVTFRRAVPVRLLGGNAVETAEGDRHEADFIVTAIGAVPNVELAEQAGLTVGDGIVVDENFRTSARNVYACGDCCVFPYRGVPTRLEAWRAARDQAEHAASAMLGVSDPYGRVPWFWSDQYDLGIQVAGIAEAGRPMVRRELGEGGLVLFQTDADGALRFAGGIATGNRVARDIKLAEMMIARGVRPDPAALADPAVNLKKLLMQAQEVGT